MKKLLLLTSFILVQNLFCFAQHPDAIIHFLITNFEDNNPYPYYPAWLTDTINPWVIDTTNSENIWQTGRPQKVFFDSAYSVPNAIVTDTVNNYPPNNHSTFEFLVIKPQWAWFKKWNILSLSFYHKYDTDPGKDGGYVEVSYDKGENWTNLVNDYHYNVEIAVINNFYPDDLLINDTIPAFTGRSDGWIFSHLYMIWPCENGFLIDSIIIRFNFLSDSIDTSKEGWMIDNIDFLLEDVCKNGVNEKKGNDLSYKVFPNPVKDISYLNLSNLNKQDLYVEIYNLFGKKIKIIKENDINFIEIRKNEFTPGVYCYRIIGKKENIYSGKFIVE
ncbi:MAG: T9SS type A sorting domain-containing protein [Bacteroidales bacterium]|nr:T9SS type A sorting domain-containing protein [Bacteroidales bacterium]